MKYLLTIVLLLLFAQMKAQTFISSENDSTVYTEFYDGRQWAYREMDSITVGMVAYEAKDNYGSYYQIAIIINNDNKPFTFTPEEINSSLITARGDTIGMLIYSHDKFMKKVKTSQSWAMALNAFSTGFNAGMAGYSTSYSTAYRANGTPYTKVTTSYNHNVAYSAQMAAQTQNMILGKIFADDRKIKEQGYMQKTTIHTGESITGYMNIKKKKGKILTVNIPVDGKIFSYSWDVSKRKKNKG